MKRYLLFLAVASVLFVGGVRADAVSDWNSIANTVFLAAARPGGGAIIDMTYIHIAIYDAVNAIDGRYKPFAVRPSGAVSWASKESATGAAAHAVLVSFYPLQQHFLDSVYTAFLATLPDDEARAKGIAIGEEVAQKFLALRSGDGRNAAVAYTFLPPGPGVYQLTPGAPPPPATPQTPWIALFRPFTLKSPSQFRAPGPPPLTSKRFARDFNETRLYGAHDNSARSPEQTEIGLFYAENPGNQFSRNIRLISAAHGFSLAENARFFAQLYVTLGDAVIAAWDSKFHYNFWRPVTAIRSADIDGNPDTQPDPTWLPLVVTPGHPEYPAAHGCVTGGLAYALEKFFKTSHVAITLTSTSVTGVPLAQHSFSNIHEIVTEVINARVYGGMHYRTSGEDGAAIARKVAGWVSRHYFKRVEDCDEKDEGEENGVASTINPLSKVSASSGINEGSPASFSLGQNYPNPFNPTTTIRYAIPQGSTVTLTVYSTLGEKVSTLVEGAQEPGYHDVRFDATGLASGVYLYRIQAGSFVETKKLLLLR
jgi:hypothetical protein